MKVDVMDIPTGEEREYREAEEAARWEDLKAEGEGTEERAREYEGARRGEVVGKIIREKALEREEAGSGIFDFISRVTGGVPEGMSPEEWERQKEDMRLAEEASFLKEVRQEAEKRGHDMPGTYEEAKVYAEFLEGRLKTVEELSELGEREQILIKKAQIEEHKKKRREFRGAFRPKYPLAKAWKTTKAILGPRAPVSGRGFYVPKASRALYVPAPRREDMPPGPESLIAEVQKPRLEMLRRESAPPATEPIRRPFTGLQRQEGMGDALARLREVSKFPVTRVEHAAFEEIRANGDSDTLKHITSELAQLGIPRAESEGAVRDLIGKGLIRETVEARGEPPIYEVVRR